MLSLTGLALQAEYGDYDVTKHHLNYFVLSCYFPARYVGLIVYGMCTCWEFAFRFLS